ncbi:MAG: AMP-binding protein [Nocardioides sp.]
MQRDSGSTNGPDAAIDAVSRWLAREDAEPWIVETSGSTGVPKQVQLSRAAVLTAADASTARLGGAGRWVLALPATYVAGFNVIARSLLAGHRPVPWADGPLPKADFISLVPTQVHRLLETQPTALADYAGVLVGGGPVRSDLRERAAGVGVRLRATYGSAETCGGCVYDGMALDGVAVAIEDDGRIRVGGPTIFTGYAGLDAGPDGLGVLVDGWFRTADVGRLDRDGRLEVLGRIDDTVICGGVKVSAPAVAARLRSHPAVSAVEVLGVEDPEWGQRVVAFVVGPLALDAARDWVSQTLPRTWAPRQLVALDRIPLLPNAKTDRLALRGLA